MYIKKMNDYILQNISNLRLTAANCAAQGLLCLIFFVPLNAILY